MLASPVDLEKLRFPVIVSPKLDGIRALITPEGPKTRMLKDIPNEYIRKTLSDPWLTGLDGEILTYTEKIDQDSPSGITEKVDDFNTIQGNVMRHDGQPRFKFVIFDDFTNDRQPYSERWLKTFNRAYPHFVHVLPSFWVDDLNELHKYEERFVSQGYEGMMIRDPRGTYKFGRATSNSQELLKMKRFFDSEATVVGFSERMSNYNTAVRNEVGNLKRSKAQEGLVGSNMLGTLIVRFWIKPSKTAPYVHKEFEIGTGFTDSQRHQLWRERRSLIGKTVTFKYQEISKYGVPRFPVFLGFRYDLEE